ncbi:MAG TPA: DUF805 domain-containing protein [Rhizomicrobium sp.]|jgi:uncharacterized membrane protein YhaH (DUF805 family)
MDFGQAIGTCLRKFVVWKGRAPRSEYWWFILFGILCNIAATIVDSVLGLKMGTGGGGPISALVSLALFLPNLSVTVRRLHDTNRSGFWLLGFYVAIFVCVILLFIGGIQLVGQTPNLALFIPGALVLLAISIWYFVLMVIKGTDGPNNYGPDPFSPNQADEFN